MAGRKASHARGFTLVELLVVIFILVILMAGIGVMFRATTRAVGASQATLELLSNVRAVQDQMQRDFSSLDKSTFMVIRTRTLRVADGPGYVDPVHIDQVSFIGNGEFAFRAPGFSDNLLSDSTAHAAMIWYGHLVIEGRDDPAGHFIYPANQAQEPWSLDKENRFDIPPSGDTPDEFVLGRHQTLMLRPNSERAADVVLGSQHFPAFPLPSFLAAPIDVGESASAHISSGRVEFALITPGELMQQVIYNVEYGKAPPSPRRDIEPKAFEAQHFCFRYKALLDPFTTEIKGASGPSFENALQRMRPVLLRGVFSFRVEVSMDGESWQSPPNHDRNEEWKDWFRAGTGNNRNRVETLGNDDATCIYSFDTPSKDWPHALRITMKVVDPTHRLGTSRTFHQIIKLPG